MCIAVFLWKSHPLYSFLLFLNRDEYQRATTPLDWWEDKETVGGRDLVGGGTWLGCTKHGCMPVSLSSPITGKLPLSLMLRLVEISLFVTLAERVHLSLHKSWKMRLLCTMASTLYSKSMIYITNRPKQLVTQVSLVKKMVEEVMTNTVKDQVTELLPQVYTPEMEYNLSSIFVDIHIANYVTEPESSQRSPSSPMVKFVSTRSILDKVIHGKNTLKETKTTDALSSTFQPLWVILRIDTSLPDLVAAKIEAMNNVLPAKSKGRREVLSSTPTIYVGPSNENKSHVCKGDAPIPRWLSPNVKTILVLVLDPNPVMRIMGTCIKANEWFKHEYIPSIPDVDDVLNSLYCNFILPLVYDILNSLFFIVNFNKLCNLFLFLIFYK